MEIGSERTSRAISFAVVVIGLAAIAAGLGAMLFIALHAAPKVAEPAAQKLLARLAWTALLLLCLTLVMIIWVVLRHIRYHLRSSPPLKRSEYIDAWELAGKRFQLEDDERDGDEGGDDQEYGSDDEDGNRP